MAYTTSREGMSIFGNLKVTYGKVTADGTTGDVDTGLDLCLALMVTPITAAKVVNITDTLPHDGSAVGVGCETNTDFYFVAFGV